MDFEVDIGNNLNHKFDYNLIVNIPAINTSELTYNDFFQNYIVGNTPCIIKNITDNWETSQFWLKNGKPNFNYLFNKYNQYKVTVYNCSEKYYNSQKTKESTFGEYLNYWKNFSSTSNASTLEYLKDWHLKLNAKNDNFYEVPIYFASDWLNEYYTQCLNDDYRFVYMGPKNTWTPFHADVFMSYSWSANVCGRKKWLLFPPGEEIFLKDNLGNLPYDVTKLTHSRKYFEVVQNPGEAIFVPSGWHHQVWNLEDTISVNHNWVNGCNIQIMLISMSDNLESIRKEIDDCKDMDDFEEHCQIMLNASFGMDYYKLYEFIKFIGISRIEMVAGNKSRVQFHKHKVGQNHILFDLKCVKSVLDIFVKYDEVNNLLFFTETVDIKPYRLLEKITQILENM